MNFKKTPQLQRLQVYFRQYLKVTWTQHFVLVMKRGGLKISLGEPEGHMECNSLNQCFSNCM